MSDSDDVDPIDEKLSEIHYTMLSIYRRCKRIGKKIDYDRRESEKVLCGMDQETLDKIGGCLKGVADSIPKLTSDDPHVFVSGCVDLAGAVAMLVPVYGPLLSGLLAIVSGVIIVSGEKTDILTVFKELIEKVLSKYRDEDIKAEAAGTKTELMTIQSYLSAFLRKGTHTKEDVTSLTSLQIPTVGTKFLGKLEYYINLYSKNKTSEDDEAIVFQARCAVDYIDIYLRLSALRQLLLLQYYCSLQNESVKQDFEATAEAVIRTLDIAMRKDKEFVKDLPILYTSPEKSVLAAVFNLSEHPTVETLLGKTASCVDIKMDGALVQLKPQRTPTQCLSSKPYEYPFTRIARGKPRQEGKKKACTIIGSDCKTATVASCFTFKQDGSDNVFTITGDQLNRFGVDPNGNAGVPEEGKFSGGGKEFMSDGQIIEHNTGVYGQWKLLRLRQMNKDPKKQLYLITCVTFPARFLFLEDGGYFSNAQAQVKVGEPGDRGYWYLDRDGAEAAKNKPRPATGWFG